jgi:hypothetical protein
MFSSDASFLRVFAYTHPAIFPIGSGGLSKTMPLIQTKLEQPRSALRPCVNSGRGGACHLADASNRCRSTSPAYQNERLLLPLAALDYHGQHYQITDPVSAQTDESASWNRDVFWRLVVLASQTLIDTSKYPLPTNLHVLPSP